MPAQKRCLSENLDDEEQHQHHAKQSRPHPQSLVDDEVIVDDDDDDEAGQHLELQPQDQQVKEEDDEDEEGGGGGEEEEEDGDGDDDEAEDKQTVKQQQQHEKEKEENEEEEDAEAEDSQGSPSSNLQEKPEFVFVQLTDIRKDVQCPICLACRCLNVRVVNQKPGKSCPVGRSRGIGNAGVWSCLVASDNSFKFCTELMRKIGEEFWYLGLVVVVVVVVVYIKRIKSTDIHFSQRKSNVML